MEDNVPDVERDTQRLFTWFSGELAVPSFNIVLDGREDGPSEFSLFACLYPDPPYYRAYASDALTAYEKAGQLGQCIADVRLPADAESHAERRHQRWMRDHAPLFGPGFAWRMAEAVARHYGIPIGGYAVEQAAVGREPRAMLFMMAFVSPSEFTERVQQAARS